MEQYLLITAQLGSAWIAGSLIGLERSFRGRPAGFRTHALVCVASAALMLLSEYQALWMVAAPLETIRTDPTRMAQGIMTGIGFLGAGVIFKEGLSVRGLTTAASIWMTAALGVLYGVGFYYPALLATVITLGTLSLFRFIESRMRVESYALAYLRFAKEKAPGEAAVRDRISRHGFTIHGMSYRSADSGSAFEYRMFIKTLDRRAIERLAMELRDAEDILEFRLSPTAD